ncbi:hypothetical protein NBZ79_15445 [Sneathiella marina]|uniref:Lipoprotein n=1 Tax=Sneathiella marina TaxID=2950108 RepID=A0ABY4W050_9PROT|nr:hypothetical protein [Sneathiella marina]USG60560.1 hypothetical protein NBZ79_15445 [Sneathiella marina]
MSKVICMFLMVVLMGCAFNVPEKNPVTQNNLQEFNKSRALASAYYYPEFPNPVTADHPLYRSVGLGLISGVPDVIRNINIAVASDAQFEEGLRETLRQSNLLSKDEKSAAYILDVHYIDPDSLTLKTDIHYKLRKKDVAGPILDREISNTVVVKNSWGGMMWQHARKAKQFSFMISFSSITWCLEHYNGTSFPDNCTLVFVSQKQLELLRKNPVSPEEFNEIRTRNGTFPL